MSEPLEAALARLYCDAELRARFLAAPEVTARTLGLTLEDAEALCALDRDELRLASHSFERKRADSAARAPAGRVAGWLRWAKRTFGL